MKKQYMFYVKVDGHEAIKVPATRDEVAKHVRAWRKRGIEVLRAGSLVPIFPPEIELNGTLFYFPAKYM